MTKSKRTTITNGLRSFRYLFAFVAFFAGGSFIQDTIWGESGPSEGEIIIFLICITCFVALYLSRRVRFDEDNIYRINGKRERATSFSSIVSIKRSRIKVNNQRMWKVTYKDEVDQEKKFRFLEGLFQHGSTQEFIQNAQRVNPSIVVWQHPFFNHPPEKKK